MKRKSIHTKRRSFVNKKQIWKICKGFLKMYQRRDPSAVFERGLKKKNKKQFLKYNSEGKLGEALRTSPPSKKGCVYIIRDASKNFRRKTRTKIKRNFSPFREINIRAELPILKFFRVFRGKLATFLPPVKFKVG